MPRDRGFFSRISAARRRSTATVTPFETADPYGQLRPGWEPPRRLPSAELVHLERSPQPPIEIATNRKLGDAGGQRPKFQDRFGPSIWAVTRRRSLGRIGLIAGPLRPLGRGGFTDEIMKARRALARASLNAMCFRVSIARVRVDDGAAQCHVRNPAPAGAGQFAVRAIS
ncbi:hypothetical protein MPL3365_170217 [Mesorhizobium plurifarium]|uniref:Uncharacterized protein n=1 Tax=Mesorhizobium plurifarium TaxID=69974 RepID=A0A090G5Z3_MESPL|nr:hypothetical protein MPL3365_170217 [Mesorhizobium plurifarium]